MLDTWAVLVAHGSSWVPGEMTVALNSISMRSKGPSVAEASMGRMSLGGKATRERSTTDSLQNWSSTWSIHMTPVVVGPVIQ